MKEKTSVLVLTERAEFLKEEFKGNDRVTFEPAELDPDFVRVTIHGSVLTSDLLSFMHAGVKIGGHNMAKAMV